MLARYLLFIVVLFALFSCKNESAENIETPVTIAEASVDDILADSLNAFFNTQYFLEDSSYLAGDSIPYQFYKIDLNSDGEDEIFVRLLHSYFCGDQGCTFLILDMNLTVINKFNFMSAPIVVSHQMKNGWNVLLTHSNGELKEIVNKNDRYPSNPAMVPASSIMIHKDDVTIFEDDLNPSKTYFF
ncbi:hypothetical protein [Portibacter lacus]|uniref:Lipoprotein n=1 Tax=Portibacter lacus TaxID=1099794 RepID=A0AA37SLJ2_9BACT|nr:hypothetical protein [Portibacter lacus]GLR16426.1 hypothetical protein GCM10007940_10410 [Portibacter lacus]